MKIELYAFTYNDEDILPFFLRHYEPLVDNMTFIDSGSTDKTLELIKKHEVIHTCLNWWDWDFLHDLRQNIWRSSVYDLIFFPDVDEFFYHPDLRRFLETNRYDIYRMEGYQMVARRFPSKGTNILDLNMGVSCSLYNKYTLFDPKADLTFPDAHNVTTTSKDICSFKIKLLHYKYLGIDYLMKRTKSIIDRVPKDSYCECIGGNILKKYTGFVRTEKQFELELSQMLEDAKRVI